MVQLWCNWRRCRRRCSVGTMDAPQTVTLNFAVTLQLVSATPASTSTTAAPGSTVLIPYVLAIDTLPAEEETQLQAAVVPAEAAETRLPAAVVPVADTMAVAPAPAALPAALPEMTTRQGRRKWPSRSLSSPPLRSRSPSTRDSARSSADVASATY